MALSAGTRLGRYEVVSLLGVGGMGEVYRARDTRLGRDVAVKVLPEELAADPERLQRFEQEALAVAALNHPNILTIHDVGVHERTSYAVTELLEGENLRELVSRRAPTQRQVLGWAVQASQGLAAAHQKGIVHRDIKPENLFVTTDGRIKILDFGLAKQIDRAALDPDAPTGAAPTQAGVVMGTVAYMSPEQVQGWAVDPRTDLFSFGVLLYELLGGTHPFRRETMAATIGAILHDTPAPLASIATSVPRAVEGIVGRCLEKRREERFQGAHDLGLALQAVLAAPAGSAILEEVEELSPYPGLSSFKEKDARQFFGREAEVQALWQRLHKSRLLAVIGPSGAGKTSFIRAGVIPAAPGGWRCLWLTPGNRPFAAVARALVPELSNDPETLQRLVGAATADDTMAAVGLWRRRHGEALLVVDQFEELFTLCPADEQARFAAFLGRLAGEAGVHVVLSLRDDFLMRTQEHGPLRPILTDLTALLPLSAEALRRALVEPAKKRGYAFEDDALVDEMVESVEGARAALPLLAFAVARLWDVRDREARRLTRAAYEEIGGVAGALAKHAEEVMDRIGVRQDVVREIFRNMVTAQGTRAVVDRDELLSAFPEKQAAEEVLRELVDGRLLTSYEVDGREGEASHRRVEVVHESLLKAWPRLVRWQTQDEEGAVLRDQLKQAARLWDEKGRTVDLLWTGTAYQEFDLWRGRYQGALTALEEDFARSMGHKAKRRKRLLTVAVACAVVVLIGVALAVAISVQQTARARDLDGARQATELFALGRARLEAERPNEALAYATASIEQSDNDAARRLAVEALALGPPVLYGRQDNGMRSLTWSRDGRWFAYSDTATSPRSLSLVSRDTGERRQLSPRYEMPVGFTADGERLVTRETPATAGPPIVRVWTLSDGRVERTFTPAEASSISLTSDDNLLTSGPAPSDKTLRAWRRLSLDGTVQADLGRWRPPAGFKGFLYDSTYTSFFYVQPGGRLFQQALADLSAPPRAIGTHEVKNEKTTVGMVPGRWPGKVVTADSDGEVRVWDVASARLERTLKVPRTATQGALDPNKRFIATGPPGSAGPRSVFLLDLDAPRSAEAAPLLAAWMFLNELKFSPDSAWLAAIDEGSVSLFNMTGSRSTVIGRQAPPFTVVTFTPDGHLLSVSDEGVLRRWPLSAAAGEDVREYRLAEPRGKAPAVTNIKIGMSIDLDRQGRSAILLQRSSPARLLLVPLDGSEPIVYVLDDSLSVYDGRLDPSGRFVALWGGNTVAKPDGIRVVDLNTRQVRTLDTNPKAGEPCAGSDVRATPFWLPNGRLVTDGATGLREWDLSTGASERLRPCTSSGSFPQLVATPDSRSIVRLDMAYMGVTAALSVFDRASRSTRMISSHGNLLTSLALDPKGTVLVTGDANGTVRVGPLTGEEPHLLYGHTAPVTGVAVSPDGRSIASASDDGTIRLWPMPDLSKPSLQTLPHDQLLTTLRALTNMRAVRDPASGSGWKIEIGPFPGWKNVPRW